MEDDPLDLWRVQLLQSAVLRFTLHYRGSSLGSFNSSLFLSATMTAFETQS